MLQKVLGLDASFAAQRQVVIVLFNYLFRKINKYEYRDQMPSRTYAKELWARVSTSGYVLCNCKLYAYARHCAQREGRRISPSAFGVSPEDAKLLAKLDLSHIKRKYKPLQLQQYQKAEACVFADTTIDLNAHIGRFISKKLIFLCRHYGVKREDIENILVDSAIYALRKQYPFFESDLHMVNVCKTAIHNAGISLIQYWTREKRNALISEADGTFSAVHVDIEVAQYMQNMGVVDAHDDPHEQLLQSLRAAKVGPRAQSFLLLARGAADPGFSLFLGVDNEDAAHEWEYGKYLNSLCEYLKVSNEQAQKLMAFLRKHV